MLEKICKSSLAALLAAGLLTAAAGGAELTFPEGTATPSEVCGACHKAIYREYAFGFGTDTNFRRLPAAKDDAGGAKSERPASGSTAHALAGVEELSIHCRDLEEGGKSCNVCHFPEAFKIPSMEVRVTLKPKARPKGKESGGLTCASCHLTPEGQIRGPVSVKGPHDTVADPAMQTSAMCATCHSLGKRVIGKQTQTFLEWREDYFKPGLGSQHCQGCHMPKTMRKSAEEYDIPQRAVARHLWTGGHSGQRLAGALSLAADQPEPGKPGLSFHVANIGAGHSVPTGSNRRAVFLRAEVADMAGNTVARKQWMFAPWYGNHPDDKAFVEEDKSRPDALAAAQADAQGPHEEIIRAGEERILLWAPELKDGAYAVKAQLSYVFNRYNEKPSGEDMEMGGASLRIKVGTGN
jgi:hypothetical protein